MITGLSHPFSHFCRINKTEYKLGGNVYWTGGYTTTDTLVGGLKVELLLPNGRVLSCACLKTRCGASAGISACRCLL